MGHPIASTAGQPQPDSALERFSHWLAVTINHAWGNPGEEAQHRPPLIGVQPYSDSPPRRQRR